MYYLHTHIYLLCDCLQRAARWRHGSLVQTCKQAAIDDFPPTYRILLSPQVCSLGAAHLREEGVEVGRFPLTAAPVFHPGDAGKTFTHWDFSNHYMSLNKTRQTGRPTERY